MDASGRRMQEGVSGIVKTNAPAHPHPQYIAHPGPWGEGVGVALKNNDQAFVGGGN
jgi:hypothetical protein